MRPKHWECSLHPNKGKKETETDNWIYTIMQKVMNIYEDISTNYQEGAFILSDQGQPLWLGNIKVET